MHSANITRSKRLQAVYKVLKDRKPHSTMDIIIKSGRVAISAIISELRENNIAVTCKRKGSAWFYKLA